jgi:hypothetical protein
MIQYLGWQRVLLDEPCEVVDAQVDFRGVHSDDAPSGTERSLLMNCGSTPLNVRVFEIRKKTSKPARQTPEAGRRSAPES